MGLAFPEMAAYSLNPVFDNIMSQKKLDHNVFSFYFNRKADSYGSIMTLGGADESLYSGNINYVDVVDRYYWTIQADTILVGGKDIGLCNNCNLIVDTGTSLITGPTEKLIKLLGTFFYRCLFNKKTLKIIWISMKIVEINMIFLLLPLLLMELIMLSMHRIM